MRWQIGTGGWPLRGGLWLIPAASIISDDGDPLTIPLSAVPTPLPLNAVSLDAAAWSQMQAWYGYSTSTMVDQRYRLLKGPGV
jgi:hypothetical protein